MTSQAARGAGLLACVLLPLALGACGSTASGSGEAGGGTLSNLLLYGGGGPVPPALPPEIIEVVDCPSVTVADGGVAIRTAAGGAESSSVRSQVSISEVARECTGRPDGVVAVKVGVQVRALLGQGAGGGRFDTPVNFVVRRGEQVLSSRTRRVAITVPGGQYEQSAVVVEDGLVVPAGTGEFDIEVSLGSGPRSTAPARARRSRS